MKAKLVDGDGKRLEFRFNPKEYSVNKAAAWTRPTNKGAKSSTRLKASARITSSSENA